MLLEKKVLVKEIASAINVHFSTVYRKLNRNKGKYRYHHGLPQKLCDERKCRTRKHRKFSIDIRVEIIALLVNEQWSPGQIKGWMEREGKPCVCVETIYRYIRFDKLHGGDLYKHCRHRLKHLGRNNPATCNVIKEER